MKLSSVLDHAKNSSGLLEPIPDSVEGFDRHYHI